MTIYINFSTMQIIFILFFEVILSTKAILLPQQNKKKESCPMKKQIAVVAGCTGCDTCRWLCTVEAITFDHNGAHIDPEKCIGCGKCADNCQSYAINMVEK